MKSCGTVKRSKRQGQAVVEFALVLPIFMLLLFGGIELGIVYFRLHLLTNAAREGARVGSMPNSTESDVEAAVNDFLNAAGIDTDTCNVVVHVYPPGEDVPGGSARAGLSDALQGDRIYVRVEHNFEVVTGTLIPGVSGTLNLQSTCVFRHE